MKTLEKVAEYLDGHSKVEKVIYPKLMSGIHRDRAESYMSGGFGSLLGFELKDGEDAGKKFIDNLKLLYHVAILETQDHLLSTLHQLHTLNYQMMKNCHLVLHQVM